MSSKQLSLGNANKLHKLDVVFIATVSTILAIEIILLCIYAFWIPTDVNGALSSSEELIENISDSISSTESIADNDSVAEYSDKFLAVLFENEYIESLVKDIKTYLNTIVTILFPLITTILSISISVSRDEIYGLNIAHFRTLNIKAKYSLFRMILITIIIFLGCVVCYFVPLALTMIALNVFAVIYSFVFLVQEIPILSRDSHKLHDVLAVALDYYLSNNNSDGDSDDYSSWHNDLQIAIGSLCYKESLKSAFRTLDTYLDDRYALSALNLIVVSYCDLIKKKTYVATDDLIKDISSSYDTISSFFDQLNDMTYSKNTSLLSFNENIYGITDLIFWFMDQVEKENLFSRYDEQINDLFTRYLLPTTDNYRPKNSPWYSQYLLNISNSILFTSFNREKTWFFDEILKLIKPNFRRYDWFHISPNYLVFISIFIYDCIRAIGYSDKFIQYISDFQNDDIWKKRILNSIHLSKNNKPDDENSFVDFSSFCLNDLVEYASAMETAVNNRFFDNGNIGISITKSTIVSWWLSLCRAKDVKYTNSETFTRDMEYNDHISQETKILIKNAVRRDTNSKNNSYFPRRDIYENYFQHYEIEMDLSRKNVMLQYLADYSKTQDYEEINEDISETEEKEKELISKAEQIYANSKYYMKSKKHKGFNVNFDHKSSSCNVWSSLADDVENYFIIPSLCYCIQKGILGHTKRLSSEEDIKNIKDFASYLLYSNSQDDDYYQIVIEGKAYKLSDIKFDIVISEKDVSLKECKLSQTCRIIDALYYKNDLLYHYTLNGVAKTATQRSDLFEHEEFDVYNLEIHGKCYLKFDLEQTD